MPKLTEGELINEGGACYIIMSDTLLTTDACLTADPGVASLIPAHFYAFVEIDHEIISMVFLLPSADSFKGLLSVTSESMCSKY